MTQADSVHSTPRTNTSAIGRNFRQFMNHRVEPATAALIICATTIVAHLVMWMVP
jgi:hypothetical protein